MVGVLKLKSDYDPVPDLYLPGYYLPVGLAWSALPPEPEPEPEQQAVSLAQRPGRRTQRRLSARNPAAQRGPACNEKDELNPDKKSKKLTASEDAKLLLVAIKKCADKKSAEFLDAEEKIRAALQVAKVESDGDATQGMIRASAKLARDKLQMMQRRFHRTVGGVCSPLLRSPLSADHPCRSNIEMFPRTTPSCCASRPPTRSGTTIAPNFRAGALRPQPRSRNSPGHPAAGSWQGGAGSRARVPGAALRMGQKM